MKNFPRFQTLLFFLYAGVCIAQDSQVPQQEIYQSCCGAEPVEFSDPARAIYVFVPNVFTPDENGRNDKFMPVLNEKIKTVNYMVIQGENADSDPGLMYQISDIGAENMLQFAWNGKDAKGNLYKGPFRYTISITAKTGESFVVKGRACSVVCGPDAMILQNKSGCFYSLQAGGDGHLDKLLPPEEDCFIKKP